MDAFFLPDKVSLFSLECPGTQSVVQTDLEVLPASAYLVLGLKASPPDLVSGPVEGGHHNKHSHTKCVGGQGSAYLVLGS